MPVSQRNEDGTWTPAEPIGWREEHNLWQRFWLWVLRRPHCSDAESPRRRVTYFDSGLSDEALRDLAKPTTSHTFSPTATDES